MKMKTEVLLIFILAMLLASTLLISATTSTAEYNPWYDLDGDGEITIYDVVKVTGIYGSSGEPFTNLAALQYDSGWIDITDKCGQYFDVTHNLNSTDLIVDITGKTTEEGGTHQRNLGGTLCSNGWSRTYGGEYSADAYSVILTSDGGYAIAGEAFFLGSGYDSWLVKTDSTGNLQWSRTYGGPSIDFACSVVQTTDGGYTMAGNTKSFGAGNYDFWLVKTDSRGNMQWNKTYGGMGWDYAYSVSQTEDAGYVIAGFTESFGTSRDLWLVKTDLNGTLEWSRTYGGPDDDEGRDIIQTSDKGFAIVGWTGVPLSLMDLWLVKTDSNGNMQWDKTYGGSSTDFGSSVVQTKDEGFALAGYTRSFGVDNADFWLVKTDSTGNLQWSRTYGGPSIDFAWSMIQTSDGGYAMTGETWSFGAGGQDFWLVKTDSVGNMQWNQTYGGLGNDAASSVIQMVDGGYALAGTTFSFGAGTHSFWLIKTDVESGLTWTDSTANTITLYRGVTDLYWNCVRVRIWKIKENP